MPIDLPDGVLNSLSIQGLGHPLYYLKGRRAGVSLQPWKPYFFPLRTPSKSGTACMAAAASCGSAMRDPPNSTAADALSEILERVAARASASSPRGAKIDGGDDQAGWMCFPRQGYTLALDFPATDASLNLLDELDDCVMRYGGRLYLAKDSRQRRDLLEAGYPNLAAFRALRPRTAAPPSCSARPCRDRLSL